MPYFYGSELDGVIWQVFALGLRGEFVLGIVAVFRWTVVADSFAFVSLSMINLRNVSAADLDLVCRHREEMFRESGCPEADLAAMSAPFRSWLAPRLTDGRYFGFIAEWDRMPIAGVGLMEIDWPPHPFHPTADRRGYVLNVFVEPAHRGHGVASLLMEASDREFERRGLTFLVLHATAAGRPVYERVGWAQTSEMSKSLPTGK